MKKIVKKGLIKDVASSYLTLVVLPVLVVFCGIFLIAGRYIYRARLNSVEVTRQAVLELYEKERKSAALSLSHMVNFKDGQVIRDAAGDAEDAAKQASEQIDSMYQLMAAPEYDILDIQIYKEDSTAIVPRWQMRYTVSELSQMDWYQQALKQPGQVKTVLEEKNYFFRVGAAYEALWIASMAPGNMSQVECVALYQLSKLPAMLNSYNKSGQPGKIWLVTPDGWAMNGEKEGTRLPDEVTMKMHTEEESSGDTFEVRKNGTDYMFQKVPKSDWYLVNVFGAGELLGEFWQFAMGSLLVILTICMLFIAYFRNLLVQTEKTQKEKYQEELLALQSQMNPHFLMNTLNTLKVMAVTARFDGMRDMVTALENILAAVLNRDGGFYRVSDEISVLNSYIYIMQFRYLDSFEVKMDIAPETLNCKVPKLLLQPVVENSITHGFDGLDEQIGEITVTGFIEGDRLIFEVTDNGQGMDEQTIEAVLKGEKRSGHRSIGVSNTHRRLRLNFGESYGVQIQSEKGKYTKVRLNLPVIHPEDGTKDLAEVQKTEERNNVSGSDRR